MRIFLGVILRKFVAYLASVITIAAVALVSAPAIAADTFTVTATRQGNAVQVGDGFTTKTSTDVLATAGTYTQSITQTWPANRASVSAVNAPDYWNLEYKVNGSWVTQRPNNTQTIEGVRASGTTISLGASGSNQKLRIPGTAELAAGSPASIPSTGRGDGWDVVITPLYILNVFHHDGSFRLECHVKATYEVCDSNAVYQVDGYRTSNVSGLTYYNGKAYAYVVNSATSSAAVLCTNVASLPFSSCGVVDLEPGVSDAQGQLSSQQRIGTKIYAADLANNKLLCYDMATDSACTEIAIPGFGSSGSYSPAFTSVIDGRLYVTANKLYCFDVTTSQECAGFPVGQFGGGQSMNVIPKVNPASNNAVVGVCAITVQIACYDLQGASATMPSGLSSLLSGASTKPSGGMGYFETNAWIGSKVYWASNPDGSDWSAGTATCYDWATDAACAGFATNTDVGASRYAFRLDPYNNNCIWANGDNGALAAFTASTGAAGCAALGTSVMDFDSSLSCSPTGAITGFIELKVVVPNGVSMSNVRVTVFDSNQNEVTGFQNLTPNVSGIVDLSALSAATVGDDFTFKFTAAGATDEQLTAITGELSYIGEPAELCVTLTSLASVCPEDISTNTLAQPGITFGSATSYQRSGSAAVARTQTSSTFTVDSVEANACYKWTSVSGGAASGLYPTGSGDGGVVDFVWDSNGKPYVGGYFSNAGGDAAADKLAYWNGSAWVAVGPVSSTESAIGGRVAALAISNGKLFVGGDFQNAGGVENADNFAIYDLTSHTWSGVGPDATTSAFGNIVRAIAVDSTTGKVYVGGNFNGRLIQLAPQTYTASFVGVQGDINNVVHFLSVASDGKVTVGGNFTDVGDTTYDRVAIWDGTTWAPIAEDQSPNGQVWSVARSGTKTYLSGDFNGVSVYDSSNSTWSSLGNPGWRARSLALGANGDIYAATNYFGSGEFASRWNGTAWVSLEDGDTGDATASDDPCNYDWCGNWKVKFDPAGNVWFGGDLENIGTKDENDLFASWGLRLVAQNNEEENNNGGGNNGGGTSTPVDTTVVIPDEVIEQLKSPVALSTGELPELKPLESMVTEDGLPVAITLTPTVTEDGLVLKGPDFQLELKAVSPDGTPLVLDEKGRLVIDQDGKAKFSGVGFLEDSPVSLWLFSEPTFLGETNTNNDGIFNGEVTIPAEIPDGEHTIQLNGVSSDGELRSVAIGIVIGSDVTAEEPTKETPATSNGADLTWFFWLFGALALAAFVWWFIVAKRRNDEEEETKK